MVFPSPAASPFKGEGNFQAQMIEYIRRNFADLLGEDVRLLDRPDGLERLQAKYGLHTLSAAGRA